MLAFSVFIIKPSIEDLTDFNIPQISYFNKQEKDFKFKKYSQDYDDLYEKNVIDEMEPKELRFKFF